MALYRRICGSSNDEPMEFWVRSDQRVGLEATNHTDLARLFLGEVVSCPESAIENLGVEELVRSIGYASELLKSEVDDETAAALQAVHRTIEPAWPKS